MPLVSVIVPSRNRAALLGRTLRSICAQQMVDFEILVVDDGSTDDTTTIAAAADPRVQVLRNVESSGVSAARNRGIAAARGRWIAFCDDDDLWSPEKLDAQLCAAARTGAAWVYSGDVNVDDTLRVLSGSPPPPAAGIMAALPRRNPLSSGGSNVLVGADVLAATGGFDTGLRRTEDWDLWLRLAWIGTPACVRQPHVAYRFHQMNIAADVSGMVAEPRLLARRYGIPVDTAATHRRAAWTALRAGRRVEAVHHYVRAAADGDWWSLARIAYATLHPRAGGDAMFGRRDPEWIAEAERWLEPLRERPAHPASIGVGGRQ